MSGILTSDDIDAALQFAFGHWVCFHVFADDLGAFAQAWRLKKNGVVVLYPRKRNKLIPFPRAAAVRAAQATKGDPAMWELAGLGTYGLLRRNRLDVETFSYPPAGLVVQLRSGGFGRGWYNAMDASINTWLKREFLRR